MPLIRQYRRDALEIGVDEAGRGCLAGPVTAAAVVLRPGRRSPPGLDDSKRVTPEHREALRRWLEAHALAWAVGWATFEEIDTENILQASMTAMHRAIESVVDQLDARGDYAPDGSRLAARPRRLLVDGHYFRPYPGLEHRCQIRGDARFQAIAAASILAKTHRDARMAQLHREHPHYSWDTNRGYPTPPHRRAIAAHGLTPWHRRSFRMGV